jgi:hypothetical protein
MHSMSTPQEQVATVANTIISLLAQADALRMSINAASTDWTNMGVANRINAFPTAPLTSTGALGTPDASPVNANPIDTRITPGSLLNKTISAQNIASMLTGLQGIAAVVNGQAVPGANAGLAQLIALTR